MKSTGDITEEEEEKIKELIFTASEDPKSKKEDQYALLTNSNSTLPLMNLSEIYQREGDSKK